MLNEEPSNGSFLESKLVHPNPVANYKIIYYITKPFANTECKIFFVIPALFVLLSTKLNMSLMTKHVVVTLIKIYEK